MTQTTKDYTKHANPEFSKKLDRISEMVRDRRQSIMMKPILEEIKAIDNRFSLGIMSEHDVENLIGWARKYAEGKNAGI